MGDGKHNRPTQHEFDPQFKAGCSSLSGGRKEWGQTKPAVGLCVQHEALPVNDSFGVFQAEFGFVRLPPGCLEPHGQDGVRGLDVPQRQTQWLSRPREEWTTGLGFVDAPGGAEAPAERRAGPSGAR